MNATVLDAIDAPALPRAAGRSIGVLTGASSSWADEAVAEYCVDVGHYPAVELAEGSYQRMVRRGRHKLIDYGDEPAQLFDLVHDPDETHDLAGDPAHRQTRAELVARARDGWDPDRARAELRTHEAEVEVIRSWAGVVRPADRHRWVLDPRYNALEAPGTSE